MYKRQVYGSLWTSSDFGASWTEQAGLGSNCWRGVAMSGDGATVAAVVDQGSIWVSTDYGSSWSETSDPDSNSMPYMSTTYYWRAVAVSSDGTTLAAASDQGVWTSGDSGATWGQAYDAGMTYWSNLRDIAMSDDGSLMAVVEYSGTLYTSSDHYSWNSPSSMSDDGAVTHDWQAIAMSADGGTIVAVAAEDYNYMGGGVYLSTDFGSTWSTAVFGGGASLNLVDVAVAGSGSRLSAVANGGQVWISADAGTTWATEPPAGITPAPTVPMAPAPTPAPSASPRAWSAIASSADGARLAATVSSGSIYTSADSGASWTEDATAGARNWASIAMSADGQRLAAVEGSGDPSSCSGGGSLWTSSDFGASWTEQAGLGSECWRGVAVSGDGATVAAVVGEGSIWVSTDYGSSWSETSDPAGNCLLYTSPSPRDATLSRMPSSA